MAERTIEVGVANNLDRCDDGQRPRRVFISYSHEDETLRLALEQHLAPLVRAGYITLWHDRRIAPGANWEQEIDASILSAEIVLLLVSPAFMASDYCYGKELSAALSRGKQGDAVVVPIVLRPVLWSDSPLAALQALPRDGQPVTLWANQDDAFKNVAAALRGMLVYRPTPATESSPRADPRSSQNPPQVLRFRIDWGRVLLVCGVMTFLSMVAMNALIASAQLSVWDTLVVAAFWLVVYSGVSQVLRLLRR